MHKLKGVGKPTYRLRGDFVRDPKDDTLAWGDRSYVNKVLIDYNNFLVEYHKLENTQLAEKDHPELDSTPELDSVGRKKYQS